MPNQEKINIVEESTQRLKDASGIYLTKYTGMNVAQATEYRKLCREINVEYVVVKNNLVKIAAKNAGYENIFDTLLEGQISISTSTDDPIAPARVIKKFNKENNDVLEVVGVYVDGKLYDSEGFKALADLPTREELIARFACMLNQPMTNLAVVLKATMTKFAGALESLKNTKS